MIQLENIRKTFRVSRRAGGFGNAVKSFFARDWETVEALADVSFTVPDGELVGFIGPNGAGKSTAVKVMSGILTPDSGSCIINGRVPWKERKAHVAELGVVFGQRSALWWDVPVADSLELLRHIYSVDPTEYKKTLDRLTEMLDLSKLLGTPTRQLSLGQRMRCEIAAALIHSPRLLFLDEPTIGLDAVSKLAVRQFIAELNRERGTTVILTTHDMQDIEALARRILLIGKGRILADGPLSDLRRAFSGRRRVIAEFTGHLMLSALPDAALTEIDGRAPMGESELCGSHRIVLESTGDSASALISSLASAVRLKDIRIEDAPIDEVIVNLYRGYGV